MLIKTLPVGHLGTNCYVVTDEQTLNCAVIDPGEESNTILDYIESNHLHCKLILLTHGHFDHVGAVYAVAEETGAVTYMNKKDDARYAGNPFMAFRLPENGRFYDEGDVVELDSLRFEVFATPGHTPGGVSYYFPDEKAVFTGDALFYRSLGRTDFPGGDHDTLLHSIRKVLFALPEETAVLPGHGPATSIGNERRNNPFCGDFV